jgi:hypothetical protein
MPIIYITVQRAGQFLTAFSDRLQDIAIIGLGTGALAAFTESGQKITYLEIDPLVHAIAENSNLFSYLSDARERGVTVDTILGDARLTLGDQKDHSYDLIILDAFSSGAIPAHLLTEEAVGIYLQKIVPKGYLLFHISNHYLNLQPIVAKVAAQHGLISLLQNNFIETELELDQHKSVSQWMLLASPDADFTGLQLGERRWMQVTPFEDQPLWTDEYSSIVRTLF